MGGAGRGALGGGYLSMEPRGVKPGERWLRVASGAELHGGAPAHRFLAAAYRQGSGPPVGASAASAAIQVRPAMIADALQQTDGRRQIWLPARIGGRRGEGHEHDRCRRDGVDGPRRCARGPEASSHQRRRGDHAAEEQEGAGDVEVRRRGTLVGKPSGVPGG